MSSTLTTDTPAGAPCPERGPDPVATCIERQQVPDGPTRAILDPATGAVLQHVPGFLADLPLAGDLVATGFVGWPDELREEVFTCGPGEFLLHGIEDIGDSEPVFTTVEHLDSADDQLPLDASSRLS